MAVNGVEVWECVGPAAVQSCCCVGLHGPGPRGLPVTGLVTERGTDSACSLSVC